jgi:hypothetical protein
MGAYKWWRPAYYQQGKTMAGTFATMYSRRIAHRLFFICFTDLNNQSVDYSIKTIYYNKLTQAYANILR